MKKLISILVLLLWISLQAWSQNANDALRYSRILYGGTARFQAMGGAFGAVGADFSVIATNPAGLGLFRSSEVTFSPSAFINHTSSDYNSVNSIDNKVNFALGDFGIVLSYNPQKKGKTSGFRNFNFAIGLNRQNDFNTRIVMQGPNNKSSLLTEWVNTLNSQYLQPNDVDQMYQFDIGLAHAANLIYLNDTVNRIYANDAPKGGVYQQKTVTTQGSISEFDISLGANFNDILYFGVTLGIPFIRYYENNQYQEVKIDETIPYFRSLNYNQSVETHGTGINLKAGVIVRPANWIRIGASIHTPTYYGNMKDNYSSSMSANFDSLLSEPQYSPQGYFNYQMITPFRAIGSLAFIIGQVGLISAEYEYVNYRQARFYSDGSTEFDAVNKDIKTNYTYPNIVVRSGQNWFNLPVNFRLGTEWRIKNFRIRGGLGYVGKPYQDPDTKSGEVYSASGGIGYRGTHFFADLTYGWSQTKQEYYFYDSSLVNPSYNTNTSNTIIATLGFRF